LVDLEDLDQRIAERVLKRVSWLARNFDRVVPEPLSGEFRGTFKLRVGRLAGRLHHRRGRHRDQADRAQERDLQVIARLKRAAGLTDYAVEARYPGAFEPVSKREYAEAVAKAEEVLQWSQGVVTSQ